MSSSSSFGTSNRESHDSSDFYARFTTPIVSKDEVINPVPKEVLDTVSVGDARNMEKVPGNSVALCVFSPPYFANKEYEQDLSQGHVPSTYLEYLEMLRDAIKECYRVLEPGGRIAINVANLGRKPFRSLSSDVVRILQDDCGFLLRGEIIWQKSLGSNGNCAWGSFAKASNPVLRDTTERVIIASKGRFDRAIPAKKREEMGFPFKSTITSEEFMAATLDVWQIAPERAKRVGHPAPYPIALPERLIKLYTYEGDVVLDPFIGSGTTALAAMQNGRKYIGFDMDESYVELANTRIQNSIDGCK